MKFSFSKAVATATLSLALMGLIGSQIGSAQIRKPKGGRPLSVVLLNEGNGSHSVRLHDFHDEKWSTYKVGPQDEVITIRKWEPDTEVFVDGRPSGSIEEVAHRDRLAGEPVYAIYFDHHQGWDLEHHDGWQPAHVYRQ